MTWYSNKDRTELRVMLRLRPPASSKCPPRQKFEGAVLTCQHYHHPRCRHAQDYNVSHPHHPLPLRRYIHKRRLGRCLRCKPLLHYGHAHLGHRLHRFTILVVCHVSPILAALTASVLKSTSSARAIPPSNLQNRSTTHRARRDSPSDRLYPITSHRSTLKDAEDRGRANCRLEPSGEGT